MFVVSYICKYIFIILINYLSNYQNLLHNTILFTTKRKIKSDFFCLFVFLFLISNPIRKKLITFLVMDEKKSDLFFTMGKQISDGSYCDIVLLRETGDLITVLML